MHLKNASDENRTELLYSEKNEYEVLYNRAVSEALKEIRRSKSRTYKSMSAEFQKCPVVQETIASC